MVVSRYKSSSWIHIDLKYLFFVFMLIYEKYLDIVYVLYINESFSMWKYGDT